MTFLQPFILWGLPLILLPVLIHLLNRMRHRPQPWAAMRFLVSATRSSVNNARLRQWLILAMRVLAVLMLVLFLSRPLAGGWLGWVLSPGAGCDPGFAGSLREHGNARGRRSHYQARPGPALARPGGRRIPGTQPPPAH
jgi:hypothetical protein